jgi:hypothetical protein
MISHLWGASGVENHARLSPVEVTRTVPCYALFPRYFLASLPR